jgi:hypothetical protein
MNQASVEAASQLAALESSVIANNAKQDALKYNSQGVTVAMNAVKEQLSIAHSKQTAILAQDNQLQHLKQFDRQSAQWDAAAEERKDAKLAKDAGRKVDEITLSKINVGYKTAGREPITMEEFQSRKLLYSSGRDLELVTMHQAGTRTLDNNGLPSVSASPSQTLALVESSMVKLADARQDIVRSLYAMQEAVQQDSKYKLLTTDEAKINYFNKYVHTQLNAQGDRIDPTSSNIRHVGDIRSYLQLPEVSTLPIVTAVLQPLAAQNKPLTNPVEVMELIEAAVAKKLVTSTQAAEGIAILYQKANMVHLNAINLKGLGIELGASATTYKVPVNAGFKSTLTNFADPVEVGTALNLMSLKRSMNENPFGVVDPDPFGLLKK